MANKQRDLSLGLGAVLAFLLPAARNLYSRTHPPELAPAEVIGWETFLVLEALATILIVALVIYVVRRYVVLENRKGDRGWDAFALFVFLAILGNVLAGLVPIQGI